MEHEAYKCKDCENEGRCMFCDGDLFMCTKCGGAEKSLPRDCPGTRMSAEQQDDVQFDRIDFISGEWIDKKKFIEEFNEKVNSDKEEDSVLYISDVINAAARSPASSIPYARILEASKKIIKNLRSRGLDSRWLNTEKQ